MLSKRYRISKEKEVARLMKQGGKIKGDLFDIYYQKGTGEKFVFVVPKRVSKKATRRNRIRRLLSEAVAANFTKFKKDRRVAVLVKKDFADWKSYQVEKELMEKLR